jgi:hypothetical protein
LLATPSSFSAFVATSAATAAAVTVSVVVACLLLIAGKGCGLNWVVATSLIVELVDDRVKCKTAIRAKVSSDCTSVFRVGVFDHEDKLVQHPLTWEDELHLCQSIERGAVLVGKLESIGLISAAEFEEIRPGAALLIEAFLFETTEDVLPSQVYGIEALHCLPYIWRKSLQQGHVKGCGHLLPSFKCSCHLASLLNDRLVDAFLPLVIRLNNTHLLIVFRTANDDCSVVDFFGVWDKAIVVGLWGFREGAVEDVVCVEHLRIDLYCGLPFLEVAAIGGQLRYLGCVGGTHRISVKRCTGCRVVTSGLTA